MLAIFKFLIGKIENPRRFLIPRFLTAHCS